MCCLLTYNMFYIYAICVYNYWYLSVRSDDCMVVRNALEREWKEAIVVSFKALPGGTVLQEEVTKRDTLGRDFNRASPGSKFRSQLLCL
jgi:hypothetical protein